METLPLKSFDLDTLEIFSVLDTLQKTFLRCPKIPLQRKPLSQLSKFTSQRKPPQTYQLPPVLLSKFPFLKASNKPTSPLKTHKHTVPEKDNTTEELLDFVELNFKSKCIMP